MSNRNEKTDMSQQKRIITEQGLFYSNFDKFKFNLFLLPDSDYYSENLVKLRDEYGLVIGEQQPDATGQMHENTIGIYIKDYSRYLSDKEKQSEKYDTEDVQDLDYEQIEEKYFYIIPESYVEELQRVSIRDINMLALKAISLKPEKEVTEALGHASALSIYYYYNNDDLKDSYKKLISNIKGNSFLCSTINLFLLENSFRINGIDEADIEIYNKVVSDYNRQLDFNIQQFNEQEKAKKTK